MDWEPWIHFVHVTAGVVLLGGGAMLGLVGIRTRRSREPQVVREFAELLSYTVPRVLIPAMAVVFLTGMWMVLAGSEWDLTQSWVITSIVGFVLAAAIAVFYVARTESQLARASASSDMRAADDAIGRWLVGYALLLVILLSVLWTMVFKPGAAS